MEDNWSGFSLSQQQKTLVNRLGERAFEPVCARYSISGPLNHQALQVALIDLVNQHEILRTFYRSVRGDRKSTLMVIADPYPFDLQITEGSGILPASPETKSFPLKVALVRKSDSDHELAVSLPALSADQDSLSHLMELIVDAYNHQLDLRSVDRSDREANQVVQYVDFVQWLDEQPSGDQEKNEKIAGESHLSQESMLSLPLEGSEGSTESQNHLIELDASVHKQLQVLSEKNQKSMASLIFASWSVALWRVCQRPSEMSIFVKGSYRPFVEVSQSIGLFDLYMPSRLNLSKELRFTDILGLYNGVLENNTALLRTVKLSNSKDRNGIKVGFSFSRNKVCSGSDGTFWKAQPVCLSTEKIPLELCVLEGECLSLELRCNSGSIRSEGILAVEQALVGTIHALIERPEQPIGKYPLFDMHSAQEWIRSSHTARLENQDQCWHSAFSDQVKLSPQAIALRYLGKKITYRDLDERANQFARFLLKRNCKKQSKIAIAMERSDMYLVAILAIHKIGAAYVPLDKRIPIGRLKEILRQISPECVVTDKAEANLIQTQVPLLEIDNYLAEIIKEEKFPFNQEVSSDDPAYILFTSGSTGKPKGVIVSHRALYNYCTGIVERTAMTSGMSYLSVTPFYTDLGNTTIFPPLMTGGLIDLAPYSKMEDAQELVEYMKATQFDVIKITPSYFSSLVALAYKPEEVMPKKALIFGGEILSWGTYRMIRELPSAPKVFNHYGPTETCVGVICQEVTTDQDAEVASTVPLGYPLKNARIYILDEEGSLLPAGAVGELYIGGSTVAKGYIEQDQVNSPFNIDPWNPGGVMYRSGDRARVLPHGRIEFLGRKDRQIKIRGYRVEIGEIESCLCQHPDIVDARVIERGDSSSTQLVAYTILNTRETGSAEWLRDHLKNTLPEFMIPAHIVSIAQFPLAHSGKVDVTMFPDPESLKQKTSSQILEPQSDTERKVAHIFKELLLVDAVSVTDDFFEIGGHSLLATRLAAQVRKIFQVPFTLRSVFTDSTLAGVATAIDSLLTKEG